MKRLVLFSVLGLLGIGALSAQSKTMYVTAKTIEVKSSTAFFSDTLGTMSYGDPVSVLQEYGKWVKISSLEPPVISGWVATASLTAKRIIVSAGTTSASANEIALAGKGFNQQVEDVYRQNGTLNYDAIDAIEALQIPNRQLFTFLQEGRLARGE
ncbi:hypothetical protein LQZ19_12760 [Treponema primitia]|uniref:hypothetical protein n=1 Tax=Treponema primitia TaxID=88058 RepID=UPI0039817497